MMNRKERRAAKAKARGQSVDRVVAVHEAGHAVGRILFAIGWSPEEVLSHIDIHPAPVARGTTSLDGTHDLRMQAITFGQLLSRPMNDFLQARLASAGATRAPMELTRQDLVPIVADMRAAGIDVDGWCLAKSVETVFGPMAEAKLLGKSFTEVWDAYSSEGDVRDLVKFGLMIGRTADQIVDSYDEVTRVAEQALAEPRVWAAILALADNLSHGRMSGAKAAKIVMRELDRENSLR